MTDCEERVWPPYMAHDRVLTMMDMGDACARWNAERLSGLAFDGDEKIGLVLTAFSVAHEHHDAILALIHSGRLASALALLRPCFEAMVRGLWLLRGGSEDQIDLYIQGKGTFNVEALLKAVGRGPSADEDAFLHETWTKSKASLHQYTHVSFQLLARRMSPELMEEPVSPDEVADAVRFATATATLASIEVARLGGSAETEKQAMAFLAMLYPESDPV